MPREHVFFSELRHFPPHLGPRRATEDTVTIGGMADMIFTTVVVVSGDVVAAAVEGE